MINSLRSELLKLRSLRSTWIVAAAAAAVSAVIGVAQVRSAIDGGTPIPSLSRLALGPAEALWFLVVVTAIVVSAGEFQHHTIRATMLLTPNRRRLLVSKSLASAGFGAVVVAAGSVVSLLAGFVAATSSGSSVSFGGPVDAGHVGAAVALGALWSVLATALGILARSTAIAIAAVLLWRFVGEGLLPVLFSPHGDTISHWTPTGAGRALVGGAGLPAATAALVVVAFVGMLCALATASFMRNDPA
jgi:ABC-2 type transport system permease protein